MKKLLVLVIGFMLIGANLFAADGDLIVNSGKVGIGTPTPSYPLTVKSAAVGGHIVGLDSGGTLLYLLGDLYGGNDGLLSLYDNSGSNDVRLAADNNSWIMNNFGIGTSSPGANFEIMGTGVNAFRIRTYGYSNYWDIFNNAYGDNSFVYMNNGGVVAKVLTTGAWQQLSDSDLKENITPLENPIEKIKAINGIKFTWKDPEISTDEQVGVLAQEVEQVLPQAVSTNDEGNKMISYASLIPLLIEAVKEQQKTIETLQAELAAIKR